MATLTVNVTQEDIDQGKRSDCNRCMVALALSRALGRPAQAMPHRGISPPRSELRPGDSYQRFPWPPGVEEKIEAFDDGDDVEPFSFVVVPVDCVV